MRKITATELRKDIYNILDNIQKSGNPVEIERKGQEFYIALKKKPSRLERIKSAPKLKVMVDDPDTYTHIDWSDTWKF